MCNSCRTVLAFINVSRFVSVAFHSNYFVEDDKGCLLLWQIIWVLFGRFTLFSLYTLWPLANDLPSPRLECWMCMMVSWYVVWGKCRVLLYSKSVEEGAIHVNPCPDLTCSLRKSRYRCNWAMYNRRTHGRHSSASLCNSISSGNGKSRRIASFRCS